MVSLFRRKTWALSALCISAACLSALSTWADEKPNAAGVEFFESKVRPVLIDNCYNCHSAKAEKLKGSLYLDTREGVLKGGENGPAIVPGDPENSLLIKAIRYTDADLQMPPPKGKTDRKLSSEQIANLEAWVKMGAPDPRTGPAVLSEKEKKWKEHWAFQPIRMPEIPKTDNPAWVKNEIDALVLANLEKNGMKPSPRADKRALIRRATFDMIGLPPTPEEVDAFVKDDSPGAWEALVDRLLASPQYGESWARHWLDVARYADTKGYVFEEERRYPYSYTYRDYVISAFNNDLPFDQFIIQQIAADFLPLGEDKRPLAAMGFLTLGRRFLNNQADIIDDRIDVVCRGLMALTVGCARCHDHKFDPIPTKDYYSLYGVFASCSEPAEKPLLGAASLPKEYPAYEAERNRRVKELEDFKEGKYQEIRADIRTKTSEYLLAAAEASKPENKSKVETIAKERKLHPIAVRRWMNFLEERKKTEPDGIFDPWFAFLNVTNFPAEAPALMKKFREGEAAKKLNPIIEKGFADWTGKGPNSLKDIAGIYDNAFDQVNSAWLNAKKEKASIEHLAAIEQESLRDVLYSQNGPAGLADGELTRLFDVPSAQKSRALLRKIEELDAVDPGSPPRGMVLQDNPEPYKPHVFLRGSQFNPGPEVPRQFLQLIAGPNRKPFQKGSGRLELAQAIASKDNPLTARVIVNRIWLNHFGAGLVHTPSDFGVRSDPPTNPELLDFLASWFMDNGWSLKKLHRLILLSNTYQQSSDTQPEYALKDPSNNLLWHMNRRRLEFEPFRDTLLAVSGKLDLKQGGHPVDITVAPYPTRRTVYSFIERQNLPGIFRTFDLASPDTSSAQRFVTTVPQQALFMINSPFVIEQARSLVRRPEIASAKQPEQKIDALYRTTLQRAPSAEEVNLAESFVQSQSDLPPPEPPVEVWQYGYAELNPSTHTISHFKALPHYTGSAWQGGNKLPDSKLGWLTLSANGGHPGEGLDHAVVRRWIAPADCTVHIAGMLEHPAEAGNGVRATIISSRLGALGFWPVYHGKREMSIPRVEVKKGDTIDFVVDSNGSLDSDSFNWAPRIKVIEAGGNGGGSVWSAREDFGPKKEPPTPLTPWEKYAQVLLMSNELAFVD
jgi:hypothetical protein